MERKVVSITARTEAISDEDLVRLEEIWKKMVRDYSPDAEVEICFVHAAPIPGSRSNNFQVRGNLENGESWSALCEDLFFAPMLLGL